MFYSIPKYAFWDSLEWLHKELYTLKKVNQLKKNKRALSNAFVVALEEVIFNRYYLVNFA